MAGGVKPSVRAEEYGVMEVLGVVGDSPDARVELGLYGGRKVLRPKHIPKQGHSFDIRNQNLREEGPTLAGWERGWWGMGETHTPLGTQCWPTYAPGDTLESPSGVGGKMRNPSLMTACR